MLISSNLSIYLIRVLTVVLHYTRSLQLCLNNNYLDKIPTPTIKVLPGNIIAYFFINLNDYIFAKQKIFDL